MLMMEMAQLLYLIFIIRGHLVHPLKFTYLEFYWLIFSGCIGNSGSTNIITTWRIESKM